MEGLSKALRGVDSADKIVCRFLKGGHVLSLTVYVFVHNLLLKVVYSPTHTHILNGALFLFSFFVFFFTLRIAPFSERSKSTFDRADPLESSCGHGTKAVIQNHKSINE